MPQTLHGGVQPATIYGKILKTIGVHVKEIANVVAGNTFI